MNDANDGNNLGLAQSPPPPQHQQHLPVGPEQPNRDNEKEAREPESLPSEQPQYAYLHGFQLWNILGALMLGMLLLGLDINIIATAIPAITDHFHSIADINWYGSAFLLAICAMQPLAGKLYTCFSTKFVYLGFMTVFEIGSLIGGLATSSDQIIAARAISGIGASGLTNGALVILTAATPPSIRPMATACGISMISIGGIISPLVGGALTQHVTWRWCFWVFIPPGGLTILITSLVKVPEQIVKPPVRKILRKLHLKLDLVGFLLFAPACVLFLIGISWGGSVYPWKSANVIGLLVGSVGIAALFCAWCTYRGDNALLPGSLLRKRTLFVGMWISCFQGGAIIMMGYYLPLWFQSIKGATPTDSGLMLLPTTIAQILGAGLSGSLVRKFRYVPPWAIFGSLLTTVGSGLMTTFVKETTHGQWIGYQVLAGFGRGAALNMPSIAVQEVFSGEVIALAFSSLALAQYLGGSVAISIANTIFQNELIPALHQYAPGVDVHDIVNLGATGLKDGVPPEELPGVLLAYNAALVKVFFFPTATAAVACLMSFWFLWKKIVIDGDKNKEKTTGNTKLSATQEVA